MLKTQQPLSNRTLQELFRMALIKSVAFVLFEISSNLVSMQKILKTFLRGLTFIFDVLSESLFVFVSYSGIFLKRTPSV